LLKFLPIYRRELKSYVTSPSIFVCVAMFFFLSGLIFYGVLDNFSEISGNAEARRSLGIERVNFTVHVVGQLYYSITFLLLFLTPIITMRLLAEEKKSGTFELLKSLPFTDWNIIIAKFLAAYTLIAAMILISLYYVLVLTRYGNPEMPVVFTAYIGALVGAAGFTAIGVFASSITENQIVAALIAFVALLGFYLIGDVLPPASGGFGRVLEALSMRYHTEQFTKGLLRLEDVAYFGLLIISFLFLSCRALELRRWKI
jgi:ABC-2 type transport system permease protein